VSLLDLPPCACTYVLGSVGVVLDPHAVAAFVEQMSGIYTCVGTSSSYGPEER